MSVCLAIDTTSPRGSLALADGGGILGSRLVEASDGFAGILFGEIESLLGEAGVSLSDIDLYAAASGPGSFTGVRIGLTAVKSLAEAHGKQVAPVSNLLALAFGAPADRVAAVLDARRGEVYAAVFDVNCDPLIPESAFAWEEFRALAADALFVSTGAEVFGPASAAPLDESDRRLVVENLAEPIAALANRSPDAVVPEQVEPNYIRRPDAERNWKSPLR